MEARLTMAATLFPTITTDVCRRYLAVGRVARNSLAEQINLRVGKSPAQRGSGDNMGLKSATGVAPRWPGPQPTYTCGDGQTATGIEGFQPRADNCPPRAGHSPAAGSGAGAGRAAMMTAEAGGGVPQGGAACR